MGPGILPETTVGKHSPSFHLQMPTKALSSERKPYVNMVQKKYCVLWTKTHLNGLFQSDKVLYGQRSPNLTFFLVIRDTVSSELKRRETFQLLSEFSSKSSISDVMGVNKCILYEQLHVLEGTMNAEKF